MGVYIKGMKMPKHCYNCDFNNGRVCFANENIVFDVTEDYAKRTKHPDCPLIEVKEPHGRLIDADRIDEYKLPNEKQESSKWHKHSEEYKHAVPVFNGALDMVKNHAPTVIEAEVE